MALDDVFHNFRATKTTQTLTPTILTGTTCLGRRFSFSKALKGTGHKNRGQMSLRAFAKSSGTTDSTGLCPGGKNELQQVSYLPHIHYFYRLSPFLF